MKLDSKYILAFLPFFGPTQWSAASAADISFTALQGQSWRCLYVGHSSKGGVSCAANAVKRLDAVVNAAGITFLDDKGRSAAATPSSNVSKNLSIPSWDCSINFRDGLGDAASKDGGLVNPIAMYFFAGDKCPFKNQEWISTKLTKKELKALEKAAKELEY